MTVQVSVEARVLGERADTGIDTVELALPARMMAADLVRVAVEEQVRTLTGRRKLTAIEIQQRLARQYGPAADEHRERAARIGVPELDVEREVARALDACRRGQCLVVVDNRPVADLDGEVSIAAGSCVRFLRLVPLAGG